jgi:hypothetical protein
MSRGRKVVGSVSALVVAVATLDYLSARVADALGIPFYLDTWATSAGVLAAGLVPGIVGGALYCALMAATVWAPMGIVWTISSANVALLTWTFARRGWVDVERPMGLLSAGILTGVLNTLLAALLEPIVYGARNPFDKSMLFRELFQKSLGSWGGVLRLDDLLVEITDKTVSIIVAAAIAALLIEPLRGRSGTKTTE